MAINCLIIDGNKNSCKLIERFVRQSDYLTFVASCDCTARAEDVLAKHKIDIIFIDEFAQTDQAIGFRRYLNYNKPYMILLGSKKENQTETPDFDVSNFIIKPVSNAQFRKVVSKFILAKKNKREFKEDAFIVVKADHAFHKINTSTISYIQALGSYVRIHTAKKIYTTFSTMKEMLGKLPDEDFSQIHRSYIVRLESISELRDGFLSIEKKLIPVGKYYKKQLMERLIIF